MGQSLVKKYIHIFFSTKYRTPIIHLPYEQELHAYLGGICNNPEYHTIKFGGFTDHVHILCIISKRIALMKLLKEVKSHSSKWMKPKDYSFNNFYWQAGYGAFSVNPAQVVRVLAYVRN